MTTKKHEVNFDGALNGSLGASLYTQAPHQEPEPETSEALHGDGEGPRRQTGVFHIPLYVEDADLIEMAEDLVTLRKRRQRRTGKILGNKDMANVLKECLRTNKSLQKMLEDEQKRQ